MLPQTGTKVQSEPTGPTHQNGLSTVDTSNGHYGAYHEWRYLVADAYDMLGKPDKAEKYRNCCCDQPTRYISVSVPMSENAGANGVYCCPENPRHRPVAVFDSCDDRFCPDCAKRETARLLARYMPKVRELLDAHHPTYRFRKIVLTTPHDVREAWLVVQAEQSLTSKPARTAIRKARRTLQRYKTATWKTLDRLLPKGWRQDQGFFCYFEFGPHGHKLHFHILFYGQWIDNKRKNGYPLATAWQSVTGGECEVVYISGVKSEDVEHELAESLKYVVKFWKQDGDGNTIRLDPTLIPVLDEVIKGIRRGSGYGVFYKLPPAPARERQCSVCGAVCERWTVPQWNTFVLTGWTPAEQRLNLRLADNSGPGPPESDNSDPPDRQPGGQNAPKAGQSVLIGLPSANLSQCYEREKGRRSGSSRLVTG